MHTIIHFMVLYAIRKNKKDVGSSKIILDVFVDHDFMNNIKIDCYQELRIAFLYSAKHLNLIIFQ